MKRIYTLMALAAMMLAPLAALAQTDCTTPVTVTSTTPFTEGFESGSFGTCWTQSGPGTWSVSTGDYSVSTGSATGTHNAKITHGVTGEVTKLITPLLDLSSLTVAQLTFQHVQRSWAGDIDALTVYYRNGANGAWVQLQSYTSAYPSWTEETITLGTISDTFQIAFEYTDHYGYGLGLDDIFIGAAPTCLRVSDITATGIDSTELTLHWIDTLNSGASYTITYISASGDTNFAYANDTTVTVYGLNPATTYTFIVEANCTDGSSSLPVSAMFTTGCGVVTVPYSTGFEDYSTGDVPNCWTRVVSGVNGSNTFPSVYNYSPNTRNGNGYFEFEASSSSSSVEIAALPRMYNLSSLRLTMWVSSSSSYPCTLEVGVLEDDTVFVPVDTLNLITFSGANDWKQNYNEYTTYFAGYSGSGDRIAIRATRGGSGQYTLFIDDLSVDEFSGCYPVTGLSVDNIDSNEVTLLWNDLNGGTASYTVVYWNAAGDTLYTTTYDDSVIVSGLSANTQYTFAVVSDCSGLSADSVYISCRTACGTAAIPFSESFEGLPTGSAPTCWTVLSGSPRVMSSVPRTGSRHLYFSGATRNAIALPPMGMPTGDLQVRFWTRPESFTSSYCGTFSVGYMTDITVDSTFVEMANWSYDSFSAYEEKEVPLTGAPDSAYIVLRHNPTSSAWYWYVDDLVVEPLPDCPHPVMLTATSVYADEIDIEFRGSISGDYIVYMSDGTVTDTIGVTADSTYTFTGLTPLTTYTIGVASDCGTEVSDPITISVTTTMLAASLPYSTGFEATGDTAWMLLNGSSANQWVIGTAVNNGGTGALYISDDNGASNNYDLNNTSNSFAYKTLTLDSVGDYAFSFDWRGYGEGSYDYLRVFLVPGSYEITAGATNGIGTTGAPSGWIALDGGSKLNTSSNWQNRSDVVSVANAGNYNMVFFWHNDGIMGTQPPAAVDNVQLTRLSCPVPSNLTLDVSGTSSLTFSWTPTGSESQWEVTVDGTTATVSTTTYTVSGLNPASSYNVSVRAVCGAGDTSLALTATFVTGCDVISTFPYIQSFEQPTAPASCWTLAYGDGTGSTNPMVHTTDIGYDLTTVPDGNRVFRFSSYTSTSDYNQYLISPEFSGINLELSFSYANSDDYGDDNIRVGYSSTTADTSAFTWGPWLNPGTTSWSTFIDTMPLGTKYFAIHYYGDYAYYTYVDNVIVDGVGAGCVAPAVTSVVASPEEVTLNFSASDTCEVYITSSAWNDNVSGTLVMPGVGTYTFTGLTPNTSYTVGVRQVCSDSTVSGWSTRGVTTLDLGCVPPTGLTLGQSGFGSQTFSWTPGDDEEAWQIHVFNGTFDQLFTVTDNPATVSGLYAGTTYQAAIRSLCGDNHNLPGVWGDDTVTFTTIVCPGPEGVTVSNVTYQSADVSWEAVSGALGYNVYWGEPQFYFNMVTPVPVTGTSYTITGLEAESHYEVVVVTRCTENVESNPTNDDRIGFTTGQAGIYDVESGTLTLYPNPATTSVSVNVTGTPASSITIEIVDLNGKTVYKQNSSDSQFTIDVSSLAQGAYFVRVTSEQQTAVRKLIVK